jgi:hypothetical protein
MTDVFLSYAREDRERIRRITSSLQQEGWDVWWDPSEPDLAGVEDNSKLQGAGVVLVVWSSFSRFSEYVRAEASSGLYRNKLVQVTVDRTEAPRPFDQLGVLDLSSWSGDRDDAEWRDLTNALRQFAGEPGTRKPHSELRSRKPSYIDRRTVSPMAVVGLVVAAAAVAGIWFGDPLGWRKPHTNEPKTAVADVETAKPTSAGIAQPQPGVVTQAEYSPEAERAWARIDRQDPAALRTYLISYPHSTAAESAHSLLRVLDAQAWVEAVDDDNEAGYSAYLKSFPADSALPGQRAEQAADRIISLDSERSLIVQQIQVNLTALGLYNGRTDGRAGDNTMRAARDFATSRNRSNVNLKSGAPRELRAFNDQIEREVRRNPGAKPVVDTAAANAAAEADRQRQAQAAAQATRAALEASTPAPAAATPAPAPASTPAPEPAATVRAPEPAATPPRAPRGAFDLSQFAPDLRATIEFSRRAQSVATTRATQARDVAIRADAAAVRARRGATGAGVGTVGGDKYEGLITGSEANGVGVRTSTAAGTRGDKYRGEVSSGVGVGLAVTEYGSQSNATRYEGDHVTWRAWGYGITYLRNGDSFAGETNDLGRGVLSMRDGRRYEGQMRNGVRDGLGVMWSALGEVVAAGRWRNGELVEPAQLQP